MPAQGGRKARQLQQCASQQREGGRQDILNSVLVDGHYAVHLRLARVSWVCSSRPSAYPDGSKSWVLGVGIRPDAVSHQSDLSTVSHSIADSAAEARAPPESLRATAGARCLLAPSGLTAVVPRRERELRLGGRPSRGLWSRRRAPLARRRPCARGWYFATSGWEIQSQVSTNRDELRPHPSKSFVAQPQAETMI